MLACIRKLVLFLTIVGLVSLAAAETIKPADLEGAWKPVNGVLSGESLPAESLEPITLTIKGNRYEVQIKDVLDRGDLKLNTQSDPAHLEIRGTEGPSKGLTLKSIVKLEEGQLSIAYNVKKALEGGGEYPADFTSTAENQVLLMVYRRK